MVKEQYGGLLTEDGMESREWSNDLNANDGTEDFVLWNDAERRTKHGLGIHGCFGADSRVKFWKCQIGD